MLLSPACCARLAVTLTAMLVALAGPAARRAAAATLYVSKSGNNPFPPVPPYCPESAPCGTIAQAVALASDGDTISIGPGSFIEGFGVTVSKNLTLTGQGPFGGTSVRSTLPNTPVFTIKRGATVTISDLQIWKGAEGVSNAGYLTLENVWVRENKGSLGAGGILNDGTLSLDQSQVAYNEGDNTSAGGIRNDGALTVSRSLIAANRGVTAGVENFKGTLIMSDSLVSKNDGGVGGSTGGIRSNGTATLTNVTITNNSGGRVGGLLSWGGDSTLTNVTVARNGYLYADGVPEQAGGIAAEEAGTITLWNTIVADNAGEECYRSDPKVTSIIGGASDLVDPLEFACGIFPVPGQPFGDPRLLPLKPNGGPTWTLALRADSPAIDAGSNEHCPATDQRGVTRPRDGDGDGKAVCDVGAYEFTPIHFRIPITPIHATP